MGPVRRLRLAAAALAAIALWFPTPVGAAVVLRTSDAEGVAVNRVAARATRDGHVLHVQTLVVARGLGDTAISLPLVVSRCDTHARRCRVAARATDAIAPAESRRAWDVRVALPRHGGDLVLGLGARSLRLVLPPPAWTDANPSWYGLKTPEALWGSEVFRAVRVNSRPARGGRVLTNVTATVALPAATLLDGLVGRLVATAQRWLTGAVMTTTATDQRRTLTAVATLSPPFRAGGYGAYFTADGEPFMVVWLPPPTA